jgi:hypothetical protein
MRRPEGGGGAPAGAEEGWEEGTRPRPLAAAAARDRREERPPTAAAEGEADADDERGLCSGCWEGGK